MLLINFVFRAGKNYYPQVFLTKCKYVIKEKKIRNYTSEDVDVSYSYEDTSDGEIIEKIQIKKLLVKKILEKKILMKNI